MKSKSAFEMVINIYQVAKEEAKDLVRKRTELFGFTWSVDHLVPLKGKTVSGLDIWSNIQVIPLSLNKRKYNSYADCT